MLDLVEKIVKLAKEEGVQPSNLELGSLGSAIDTCEILQGRPKKIEFEVGYDPEDGKVINIGYTFEYTYPTKDGRSWVGHAQGSVYYLKTNQPSVPTTP